MWGHGDRSKRNTVIKKEGGGSGGYHIWVQDVGDDSLNVPSDGGGVIVGSTAGSR